MVGILLSSLSGIEDIDGHLSKHSYLKSVAMMLSFLKPRVARKNLAQTGYDSLVDVLMNKLNYVSYFSLDYHIPLLFFGNWFNPLK